MKNRKESLQKLSLHAHSWIATAMALIGILFMGIGKTYDEGYLWAFIVGVILVVITLIYCLIVFRCPHCDSFFGTRTIPEYCPHCGKKLEE